MTYKIVAKTNGWIAGRDTMFNGKTEVILRLGLELKEAQSILLDMFNEYHERDCRNWGMAVIATKDRAFGAYRTCPNGTRRFDWDSRVFEIEEE